MFNEIDFILTRNVTLDDVDVLSRISVSSDHRLIRAKLKLNTKRARIKLIKSNSQPCNLEKLKHNAEDYKLELANRFCALEATVVDLGRLDLEELNEIITREIIEGGQKVAKKGRVPTTIKLTTSTEHLIQHRNNMIASATG